MQSACRAKRQLVRQLKGEKRCNTRWKKQGKTERDGERKEAGTGEDGCVLCVARFLSMAALIMFFFLLSLLQPTTMWSLSLSTGGGGEGSVPGAEGGGVEKRSEQKRVKLV